MAAWLSKFNILKFQGYATCWCFAQLWYAKSPPIDHSEWKKQMHLQYATFLHGRSLTPCIRQSPAYMHPVVHAPGVEVFIVLTYGRISLAKHSPVCQGKHRQSHASSWYQHGCHALCAQQMCQEKPDLWLWSRKTFPEQVSKMTKQKHKHPPRYTACSESKAETVEMSLTPLFAVYNI